MKSKIDNKIFKEWDDIFSEIHLDDTVFDDIFQKLSSLNEEINEAYRTKVRHYYLKKHTLLVVRNYKKYFYDNVTIIDKNFFLVFLFLHDIGKPKAQKAGNLNHQYFYSIKLIESIWSNLPFDESELLIVKSLLEGDSLGKYFRHKITLEKCCSDISTLARKCNLHIANFFQLFMVYYQCDIAAYTKDAGGLKFLEYLFYYQGEEKVFDSNESLLKFSPKHQQMYHQLKEKIKLWE